MTNDNNELKNIAPCEEKQEARELTPDEMAKVSGGRSVPRGERVIEPLVYTDSYFTLSE